MAYKFSFRRICVLLVSLAVFASVGVTAVSYAKWASNTSVAATISIGRVQLFGFSDGELAFTTNEGLIPYDQSETPSGMTTMLKANIPEYYTATSYTITVSFDSTNFANTTEFYVYICNKTQTPPPPLDGWKKLNATFEYNDITEYTTINDKVLYLAMSSLDISDMNKSFTLSLTLGCVHNFEYEVITNPTCVADGVKKGICSNCKQEQNFSISATGHSFTNYQVTTNGNCTIDKVETAKCDNCEQTNQRITPAIGSHSYNSNKICTRCGQSSAIPADGATLLSDGNYAITKVDRSLSTVVFPSTHNGVPVTQIGSNGTHLFVPGPYDNNMTLTSVVIPDSVTTIAGGAFYHCPNLQNITMSDNIETVGVGAFDCGGKFSTITLGENLTEIGYQAFWGCKFTEIIFKGTKEQWKKIKKGGEWNAYTQNYIVRCSDGNLSKAESEIQIS